MEVSGRRCGVGFLIPPRARFVLLPPLAFFVPITSVFSTTVCLEAFEVLRGYRSEADKGPSPSVLGVLSLGKMKRECKVEVLDAFLASYRIGAVAAEK